MDEYTNFYFLKVAIGVILAITIIGLGIVFLLPEVLKALPPDTVRNVCEIIGCHP